MFDPLDVPGYDVLVPLGGAGRSWKALAAADRARVVLRRVHGSDDTRLRLRQEAALWASMPGGHVVAVRDVFSVERDVLVVVSDYAPGGGLDGLLRRRGSLEDGEVVTLVVPLAETLAAAHRRGLVHGRISTGNIVFGDDGRPMLTHALPGASADAAAGDVAALVAVAKTALGGRPAGPIHNALAAAPASAAELASAVRAAMPARAIAMHAASEPTHAVPAAPAPLRPHPRLLAVLGAIVVIAVLAGVLWGRRDAASGVRLPAPAPTATVALTSATVPPPTSASRPWWGIVQRLEAQRLHSYVAALGRAGLRPVGLRIQLQAVRVLTATADRAVVRVLDGWASYEVVSSDGRVVGHRPARAHREVTLVLRRMSHGWRLQRVVR